MMSRSPQPFYHLHLVSDSTGETLNTVAKATTAQYGDHRAIEHIYALVRTPKQLARSLQAIAEEPGPVLYTIVDKELRRQLEEFCAKLKVPCISILDPVIAALAQYLNTTVTPQIGGQHALNSEYFARIDALNYCLAHDDGQNADGLENADVVVLGISRTSKTPTCIYLAQRGVRAGNVPVVPGISLPGAVQSLKKPLVVGLVATAERIAQIRRHRLVELNESRATNYADARFITDEIVFMKKLCSEHGWPMVDVTRRSVEETAASIINLLAEKQKTDRT